MDITKTRAYKKLKAQFKERCRTQNAPCHLCNGELGPILYTAPPNTPLAFDLDHLIPVTQRPDLAYQTSLWRASHVRCNRGGYRGRHQLEALGLAPAADAWVKPTW